MTSLITCAARLNLLVGRKTVKTGCWSFLHPGTNLQVVTGLRGDEFARQIARRFEAANPREHGLFMYWAELDFNPDDLGKIGFNADDIDWMLCAPVVQQLQAQALRARCPAPVARRHERGRAFWLPDLLESLGVRRK